MLVIWSELLNSPLGATPHKCRRISNWIQGLRLREGGGKGRNVPKSELRQEETWRGWEKGSKNQSHGRKTSPRGTQKGSKIRFAGRNKPQKGEENRFANALRVFGAKRVDQALH